MEGSTRLVVYEKSHLYREGLCLLLRREKDFEVVVDTADIPCAISYVLQDQIDLCLASVDLLHSNWDQYNFFISELGLKTKVLILSNSPREDLILQAMHAGTKGYLFWDIASDDLVRAIREISAGGMWFQARGTGGQPWRGDGQPPLGHYGYQDLTAQEVRVLEMVRQGFRNKEVGARLNISEKTVKCHVHKIFKKLNITKRIQIMN